MYRVCRSTRSTPSATLKPCSLQEALPARAMAIALCFWPSYCSQQLSGRGCTHEHGHADIYIYMVYRGNQSYKELRYTPCDLTSKLIFHHQQSTKQSSRKVIAAALPNLSAILLTLPGRLHVCWHSWQAELGCPETQQQQWLAPLIIE